MAPPDDPGNRGQARRVTPLLALRSGSTRRGGRSLLGQTYASLLIPHPAATNSSLGMPRRAERSNPQRPHGCSRP